MITKIAEHKNITLRYNDTPTECDTLRKQSTLWIGQDNSGTVELFKQFKLRLLKYQEASEMIERSPRLMKELEGNVFDTVEGIPYFVGGNGFLSRKVIVMTEDHSLKNDARK